MSSMPPTAVSPLMALVTDISGECSAGVTPHTCAAPRAACRALRAGAARCSRPASLRQGTRAENQGAMLAVHALRVAPCLNTEFPLRVLIGLG